MEKANEFNIGEETYSLPEDRCYGRENHMWAQYDPEKGEVIVGIDALGLAALGDLAYVTLLPVGTTVRRGKSLGTLEAAKMAGDLKSPVSGVIVARNEATVRNPGLVNQDSLPRGLAGDHPPQRLAERITAVGLRRRAARLGRNRARALSPARLDRLMDWRLICDDGVTASFGLSADETIAERVGAGTSVPTLRLYSYRSYCALVGRFQNVDHELRVDFCRENNIPINRRPTGGGAIIMGEDQLGVALTLPAHVDDTYSRAREIMTQFSTALVQGLKPWASTPTSTARTTLWSTARRSSGWVSIAPRSDGLLFHASVLVDLDVPYMLRVLNTPFEKISDKEIAAIGEHLTTVRRETGSRITVPEVRKIIIQAYEQTMDVNLVPGYFSDEELKDIRTLEREKYQSDDWIYQTSQVEDTSGGSKIKTPEGLIDVRVTMAGATIKAAYIGGDFFASAAAVAELEGALRWHSGQPEKVAAALEEVYMRRREEFNSLPLEYIVLAVQKAVARSLAVGKPGRRAGRRNEWLKCSRWQRTRRDCLIRLPFSRSARQSARPIFPPRSFSTRPAFAATRPATTTTWPATNSSPSA